MKNLELEKTWHFVEKWAEQTPDKEALISGDEKITWSQFKIAMDNTALSFLELGVNQGDCIAFLAMAQNEFLVSFMAANKVGAMWLGINPKLTLNELRFQLSDSQPKILITLKEFMGNDLSANIDTLLNEFEFLEKILVLDSNWGEHPLLSEFITAPRTDLIAKLETRTQQTSSNDSALLMYTSGSTGKPKGVIQTHHSIISNVEVQNKHFNMHQDSRALLHFPINHVAADVEIGFAMIMAGGCSVMMDHFHPVSSLNMIAKEKISILGQMPVMFLLQMKQPEFQQVDLSSIETFIWAGAAAPKEMVSALSRLVDKSGAKLITGYGSTETCGFVTYTTHNEKQQRLIQSAGKIAAPFELKIVDDQRKSLATGPVGEIAVKGEFIFSSYLNQKEQTDKVLENGWYYTGDLARIDEDGYIYISGRKSEMYKSGGENIFPREIEDIIESHTDVIFAAVIGVPDKLYQEVGWAYIMRRPNSNLSEQDLHDLCSQHLVNYKIPKRFFIEDSLPLLASGKINKLALKKRAEK